MCKLHLCPMAYYAKNFHFYGSEVAQSGTAAVAAAEFNAQCYDLNVIGWVDDGRSENLEGQAVQVIFFQNNTRFVNKSKMEWMIHLFMCF